MSKLVSLLIVTRNRSDELFETIENLLKQTYSATELIVIENGSDPDVRQQNQQRMADYTQVQYHVLDQNLGVSGGRNFALEKASGDIVIEIDDDAVFLGDDMIAQLVDFMTEHPEIGVVAFKITDHLTNQVTRWEFPFRDKSRDKDRPGPCAWFIGAGHAFSRAMLDRVGIYRDYAPYGEEEQDLALRVLDEGFDLYYYPTASILHKRSPRGRISQRWKWGAIHLMNKMKVPLLNLPWVSVLSYALIRGPHFTLKYKDPRVPFVAAWYLVQQWRYIRSTRKRLGRRTLRKLSALRGNRYY